MKGRHVAVSPVAPSTPALRLRKKGPAAPPEPVEKEEDGTKADSDEESYDADSKLECEQCEQKACAIDIHCPKRKVIKWNKYNRSRVTGRLKATQRKCYPCFAWTRWRKKKDVSDACQ